MENKRHHLIEIDNQFLVREADCPRVNKYNVINSQQEIFDMLEDADIRKEFEERYYSVDFSTQRRSFLDFRHGYKSNPAKWTDEDLIKLSRMIYAYRLEELEIGLDKLKQKLKFQKLPKEIFVELEIAKPSESFAPSMNYVLERQSLLNFYPNNSVKITKVIL